MKKFLIGVLASCIFLYGNVFAMAENKIVLTVGETKAYVFGDTVENDVPPIIKNNRTFIPLRFVAENLGAQVIWDGDTKQILIVKGQDVIWLTVNSDKVFVNEAEKEIESPVFIENERTYVPVRIICESLGAQVLWNCDSMNITILFENKINSAILYKINTKGEKIEYESVREMLDFRLKSLGYTDADININDDNNVEIVFPVNVDNVAYIAEILKSDSLLTFTDHEDNVLLSEDDIENVCVDNTDNSYSVLLEFNEQGREKFKEATARISKLEEPNNFIRIKIDDSIISAPVIRQELDGNQCFITGPFTQESADSLVSLIKFGALSFTLEIIDIY